MRCRVRPYRGGRTLGGRPPEVRSGSGAACAVLTAQSCVRDSGRSWIRGTPTGRPSPPPARVDRLPGLRRSRGLWPRGGCRGPAYAASPGEAGLRAGGAPMRCRGRPAAPPTPPVAPGCSALHPRGWNAAGLSHPGARGDHAEDPGRGPPTASLRDRQHDPGASRVPLPLPGHRTRRRSARRGRGPSSARTPSTRRRWCRPSVPPPVRRRVRRCSEDAEIPAGAEDPSPHCGQVSRQKAYGFVAMVSAPP